MNRGKAARTGIGEDFIAALVAHVKAAGNMALDEQPTSSFLHGGPLSGRTYKDDGSVVTEADRRVEHFLVDRIAALQPAANIIAEESRHPFDDGNELTFAVDPIDGTDVFSQGMPGWCVSVGLLDGNLVPIAGVVFAPRLDLLIVAHGGDGATLNGSPLLPQPDRTISSRSTLMVTSRIHRRLDLSGYAGKIRGIGSAALHLCYALIYPAIVGALEGPGVHIWDMAAAHAINRAQGHDLCYLGGDPIDYAPMVDGGPGADVVMAGSERIVAALRKRLKRLGPDAAPGPQLARQEPAPGLSNAKSSDGASAGATTNTHLP